jgi:hypothetical protein
VLGGVVGGVVGGVPGGVPGGVVGGFPDDVPVPVGAGLGLDETVQAAIKEPIERSETSEKIFMRSLHRNRLPLPTARKAWPSRVAGDAGPTSGGGSRATDDAVRG